MLAVPEYTKKDKNSNSWHSSTIRSQYLRNALRFHQFKAMSSILDGKTTLTG